MDCVPVWSRRVTMRSSKAKWRVIVADADIALVLIQDMLATCFNAAFEALMREYSG